ncbi:peptide/nickel transport system ATP-binding protein [Devosia lucknowensis]|uniref:Glutathione import ATP-binding protein GsiA n=1 Tax=Devosia lucknowensis TaxID=1096929 RepID=A0A1Y6G9S3_9HYPH|nr:ABC transporter ATP-binding protein [Devosia lucknowensis]SMQ85458.1 peptide/nickel transport system ATP-binding protein [Devosia lucknowensis]
MTEDSRPLLVMRDVSIEFETPRGPISAVRNFNLTLEAGRKVAIVGESGSGKSTIAAAMNGLLAANGRIVSGEILFQGRDIARMKETELRAMRGSLIGLVPQDPMTNLNPLQRVGTQIAEALEVHGKAIGKAALARAVDLLEMVGIPEPSRRARQYPHELSGGMRQRVLIAAGLACEPKLLLADEPTSALDVTVQRVILEELDRLTSQLGTALVLITHDLAMAAEHADDVVVMYRGDVVENGDARAVLRRPSHEYTRRLVAAAPTLDSTPLITTQPGAPDGSAAAPLVKITGLRKVYGGGGGLFEAKQKFVAVAGSDIAIARGQTVAIVGESGSGKSTTARMLLKIEEPTAGDISFDGVPITHLKGRALFAFRRRMQPVFQNPFGSLDARYTVLESIEEPMILHGMGDATARAARVRELLDQVALPQDIATRRPAEISGGQSQRVAIARALALRPDLIVLDEAVSALDVIVQAQVLELLVSLQRELGLSYLFISHNLAVVRLISHMVHVMKSGEIVESGPPERLFTAPQHPYTRELIAAIPGINLTESA